MALRKPKNKATWYNKTVSCSPWKNVYSSVDPRQDWAVLEKPK